MGEYIQEAKRSNSVWARPLSVSLLLAAAFGLGLAQGGSAKIAENAHMKTNGNGWACNEGYREFGDGCMLDKLTRADGAGQRDRPEQRIIQLEKENARLRREIDVIALRNAVLNAELYDSE